MTTGPVEIQCLLDEVRRRWTRRSVLRSTAWGLTAAAVVLLTGWVATIVVARQGLPLVATAAFVLVVAAVVVVRAAVTASRRPTDAQVARLIEERDGELDDVLTTAVEYAARADATPRMREALFADASRLVAERRLETDLDHVIARASVRRAALQALGGAAALTVVAALFAPALSRAANVASAYLFPARLVVEVSPGDVKVQAGHPLTISARTSGLEGEIVPTLSVTIADETRNVRMSPDDVPGTFVVTLEKVTTSFAYHVSAATARSNDFGVTVIRPARVERVDLHYEFPKSFGLEPRTEEDSGDIYGPVGTTVRLTVATDKPIATAALSLANGAKVPLTTNGQVLEGRITIAGDDAYRIALADIDALENPGDVEYFIRTLEDRPPDVRILRPASDRKVSPLEEVFIEARADDDFGISSLDLVFMSPDGRQRAVPLGGSKGTLTASGLHTLYLEDMKLAPGDLVSYFARARDVSRGRRGTEVRSDIFFLEVKPFEEEFIAAQSQQMGQGAGMQGGGLEALIDGQKQIIAATWNLDARGQRAQGRSPQDIRAVARAQADLRDRAEKVSAENSRLSDPRMRRRLGIPTPTSDPIGKAVEAMGRAVGELDKLSTSAAVPHEMEALNQLLKAEAENRRRQVTRSQQAGGGGGQNRAEADLSSLFDQELRRRQSTNYETPNSTEERQETKREDPLEQIRELARRQDALSREQRELARQREQLDAEAVKRQLERLSREQQQLREQAQQLAQQMQRGQGSPSAGGAQDQQESRRLREISEDMRNAAAGLQRQDAEGASQSSSRAADRLRDLERQVQAARPDERRRALGDFQLESRQLADEQRRLAQEAARTGSNSAGDDARRRLAAEQERLADRAQRLQDNLKRLAQNGKGDASERRATEQAARELDQQKVGERMQQSADSLRGGGEAQTQQREVARALDRAAEHLGAAAGTRDADARRHSDQLARAQELRDRLQEIDRNIQQLQRDGGRGQQADQASQSTSRGQPQGARGEQQGGSGGANGGRLAGTQREVNEQMREAERLAETLRRDGMQANPDAGWWRSVSAPGTEAFKQDFARWESLKKHLLLALEGVETRASDQLRMRQNEQRLNAGGHDAVNDAYRDLVEKYYRSLAAPRRPQ